MIYLELFWSMFQVGLFSVGGGYVAIPLIQHQIVELNGWLTATEFTDIITIAEMTPGPIAINSATFVGIRVCGLPGAVVATLACVLPSCIIVLILARIYYKYRSLNAMQYILSGLRPAVVAMIASAGLGIMLLAFFSGGEISLSAGGVNFIALAIFAAGMFILRKWKINPLYIIGGSGAVGLVVYGLLGIG
jgi:chromate transporter